MATIEKGNQDKALQIRDTKTQEEMKITQIQGEKKVEMTQEEEKEQIRRLKQEVREIREEIEEIRGNIFETGIIIGTAFIAAGVSTGNFILSGYGGVIVGLFTYFRYSIEDKTEESKKKEKE
ncbi:MAG: hypothetical protein ACPLXS_01030 [Candidatus Micrarchaeales archaeon]